MRTIGERNFMSKKVFFYTLLSLLLPYVLLFSFLWFLSHCPSDLFSLEISSDAGCRIPPITISPIKITFDNLLRTLNDVF